MNYIKKVRKIFKRKFALFLYARKLLRNFAAACRKKSGRAAFLLFLIFAFFPLLGQNWERTFVHTNRTLAVPVIALHEEPEEEITYEPDPVIILCATSGTYFDINTGKIIFPSELGEISVTPSNTFYTHEIVLKNITLESGHHLLVQASPLIFSVETNSNILRIHTRPAAYIHIGENYIRPVNIHDVYHTIIVLDPGHGGIDTGAINVLGRNYQQEADIVLAISNMVIAIFDEPGVLIIPTRTQNVFVNNTDRYRLANRIADYFISIHTNAYANNRVATGMLTLYGTAEGSSQLAQKLQDALVETLESHDRGIEYAEFRILRGSVVPVALLELLFLSTPSEARRLIDEEVQLMIAETIAEVLRDIAADRQDKTADRHNVWRSWTRIESVNSVVNQ